MKRPFKLERLSKARWRVEGSFTSLEFARRAFPWKSDEYAGQYSWRIRNEDTGEVWEL